LIDFGNQVTGGTRNGDIPAIAEAMVQQTGASPRTLSIGNSKFQRVPPFGVHLGLATNATVVQVYTNLTMTGPGSVTGMNDNKLFGGAKTSRNADFTACPGTGLTSMILTACPSVDGGAFNGRVTYTQGVNQFGGVMQMMIQGSGVVTNVWVASPTNGAPVAPAVGCPNHQLGGVPGGCPVVVNRPFGGGGAPQVQGGPFNNIRSDMLLASAKHQLLGTGACTQMVGPYDVQGCVLSWTPTGMGVAGPSTNKNVGFPWTTGMVKVSATEGPTPSSPNTTFTSTGFDHRTANGAGNIVLVSGAVTKRDAGSTYASQDQIVMALVPTTSSAATPSMAPVGIAAFMGLMALAGGYRLRKQNRR